MIKGQCQCGNIQLEIPRLTETATSCSCSTCHKYGVLWGYFTESDVKVSVGADGMDVYCHGDRLINFNRCRNCGCVTHYTSTTPSADSRLAVNYRMFPLKVLPELRIRHFDGAVSFRYTD